MDDIDKKRVNNISKVSNCTGCGLCSFICPTGAIEIIEDENKNHFFFPQINEDKCIDCGLCLKKCPSLMQKDPFDLDRKCYLYQNKDKTKLLRSASGGAFNTIAEEVLSNGGVVYGAAWDGLSVIHKRVDSLSELPCLNGSKYVQSYISRELYNQIKNDIKNNRKILFSGTPCQVAAVSVLFSYFKYDNGFLVEIICHGVPNQWTFRRAIELENERIHGNIYCFEFRHKKGFEKNNTAFKYCFSKGDNAYVVEGTNYYFPYYKAFHTYSIFRDSCYSCNFRSHRYGDLIIGDFWGLSKLNAKYKSDFDKSVVLPLTKKGELLCSEFAINTNYSVKNYGKFNEGLLCDSSKEKGFANFYNENASDNDLQYYKSNYYKNPKLNNFKVKIKNAIKCVVNLFLPNSKKYKYYDYYYRKRRIL